MVNFWAIVTDAESEKTGYKEMKGVEPLELDLLVFWLRRREHLY